jgi:hypothetical protein
VLGWGEMDWIDLAQDRDQWRTRADSNPEWHEVPAVVSRQ